MSASEATTRCRPYGSWRAVLTRAFALVLALPALARADVDLTNAWVFSFPPSGVVCDLDLVQSVGSLSASGTCRGLTSFAAFDGGVDPQTGEFSLSGTILVDSGGGGLVFSVELQGAPAGEGRLAGTATINGEEGTFEASLCGNGNVDAGEACDDGAATNGCCTSACTPKPDGISCATTAACQSAPTCSAGACVGTPMPAGTECEADGNPCTDDACDGAGACAAGPCSPCCGGPSCTSAPRFTCKGSTDARDLIDVQATPLGAKDKLIWRIPHLEATSPAELPDPLETDYALCMYTLGPNEIFGLYFDAVAPAGLGCGRKRCWTKSPKGAVAYNGGRNGPDGVATLRVKPGADGKAQLSFAGRGPKLDTTNPLFIGGGELLVELHAGDACWGAHYFNLGERPDIRTETRYKKKGSLP